MHVAPEPNDRLAAQKKASTPWVLLLLAVAVISNSGCALGTSVRNYLAYNDTQNDFVMGFRNSVWARQAWSERGECFAGEPQIGAFGAGFRAGYVSVASGGNGCPPPVPPRKYWTWKYQTPEGQAKVAAWFSGFPYGAQAAEEDQAGEYQNIQVSYAIERQYSPEFTNSSFIEQVGEDGETINGFEVLPNPSFSPAPEALPDSVQQLPPASQPPTHIIMGQATQPPMTTIPAAYEQPLYANPLPSHGAMPQ